MFSLVSFVGGVLSGCSGMPFPRYGWVLAASVLGGASLPPAFRTTSRTRTLLNTASAFPENLIVIGVCQLRRETYSMLHELCRPARVPSLLGAAPV